MNIPKFSVNHPVTVSMLVLVIAIFGVISFTNLGLDLLPDITYPIVSVVTNYPGASPQDIEELITKPLEGIISTVKNVKKVTSVSFEGTSVILVEFEWGTNIDFAAQDIRDSIDIIKAYGFRLPEGVERPVVFKFDITQIPILYYGITSSDEHRSLRSLKSVINDMMKDKLQQIDGVATVNIWGGEDREILLEVDKTKLELYGITLNEIVTKLQLENINLPAGNIKEQHKEYILRTVGKFENLEEIRSIPITSRHSVPVYLKDIVEIKDTVKETNYVAKTNKRGSLMLWVTKESGANTVVVARKVKKEIEKIKKELPEDIILHEVIDMSRFITRIVNTTASNALLGSLLAIGVLYLFLRNLRPTLTIAVSIPYSILTTFVPLYFLGQSLNFVTMVGLALGVGMLVDNSIVVIENIYRHFTEGEDRITASITGASEVGMAITASTFTTIVVFLPLIFVKGITGKLFEGLSITITASLLASLIIALTIVPVLTSKILSRHTINNNSAGQTEKFMLLKNVYVRILKWVLNNKGKVLSMVFGTLFVVILITIFFAGREFFPSVDNNMAIINVKLPVGTRIEETCKIAELVENLLLKEKYVRTVMSIVGIAEGQETDVAMGTGPSGPHEGTIFVRLYDRKFRKEKSQEIISRIRKQIPQLANVSIEFYDIGRSMMTGGAGQQKPIDIKLFGKDLQILKMLDKQIRDAIAEVPGVTDVSSTLEEGKPELVIRINRDKANKLGLNVYQIAQEVQSAVKGRTVTQVSWGGEEINLRIRYQEKYRATLEDLKKILIPVYNASILTTRRVSYIYLDEIADIVYDIGPIKLYREDQKRYISIQSNVEGRNIGKVLRDIKKTLEKISLPEGYFIKFAGEAEQMAETFRDLGLVLLFAIVLIYMVMAAQFESFVHPFTIMFTVPFSVIGVLLGLLISGKPISLPAGMGMLVLSGVIVNNGIVLVDYINQLRRKGKEKYGAIIEACLTRLRPVLMTAITTILGVLPMIFSRQEGAEMRSVVGVVLASGLLTGTILTLIVLPTVYSIVDEFTQKYVSKLRFLIRKDT